MGNSFDHSLSSALSNNMAVIWTDIWQLRYIAGFWLVEVAISTNPKSTLYRNLYDNKGSAVQSQVQ